MGEREYIQEEDLSGLVYKDIKKSGKNILKKDNRLIECRYELTALEYKLLLFVISFLEEADISENGFPVFRVPTRLFLNEIGDGQSEIYSYISKMIQGFMSKVITFERINEEGKREYIKYNLISRAKYTEGSGIIEIQIHRDLLPFFLYLKERYTKIPLQKVFELKSKYSIRLYELTKQYENTGYRKETLEKLRFFLGIENNEYSSFDLFERKVLSKAVSEITDKTDIAITYNKIREGRGRKVVAIEFFIRKKEDIQKEINALKSEAEEKLYKIYTIAVQRERMKDIIENIIKTSGGRITENEILFLSLNANIEGGEDIIFDIIKTTSKNKAVKNPFGLLVKLLDIDLQKANYKELLNTQKKVEVKMIEEIVEYSPPAYDIMKEVVDKIKQMHPEAQNNKGLSILPDISSLVGNTVLIFSGNNETTKMMIDYAMNYQDDIVMMLRNKGYRLFVL